jgi:membrane fusion protein (multidrug efflux system)
MSAVSPTSGSLGRRLRLPLMLGGVLLVAAAAGWAWLSGGRYMSTDDAYVQAARASISSNVSGRVIEVAVHDNQRVHRGDLLFRLDDQPFRIAVAAAQAKLASARLQVNAGKAAYRQQLASVRSAAQTAAYQQTEFLRQQKQLESGIVSQSRFNDARHARDAAQQQLAAAQQQAAAVLAALGGDADIDPEQHPSVLAARAELDRTELDLSYTHIVAPDDGVVAKVEQLQVGDSINAANPVFALLSTRDVWVEANFKEDQLTHMRPGQAATVRIDTYPGIEFKAHVASVAPGTGSQFSALPPENATGNWVKVVQRLPVRIELDDADPALPLHSGLSTVAEVDTGYRRSLFGKHGAR